MKSIPNKPPFFCMHNIEEMRFLESHWSHIPEYNKISFIMKAYKYLEEDALKPRQPTFRKENHE